MQSIIEKYLSVNPKRLNPFNAEHHDFVPSDDAAADADYLALVEAGETSRFYVTLTESATHAGRYRITVYDGYNGNVLVSTKPERPAPFAGNDDHLFAALRSAIAAAARLQVDFRPDLAVVFSDLGHDHAELLQRYAAGSDGDAATEWVSWNAQTAEVARG